MSENKHDSKLNNEKEPALSELISSAKENIEKNKSDESAAETALEAVVEELTLDSSEGWFEDTLPEISFASVKPEETAPAAPKVSELAEKISELAEKDSKPAEKKTEQKTTVKPASAPEKPKSENASAGKKAPAKKKPQGAAAGKKPVQNGKKPVQKGKKPPQSAKGGKKPAPAGRKSRPASAQMKPSGKKPAGKGAGTAAAEAAKKGKFTKKQVGIVVGLIAALLLVLLLIVYLIFSHYYNLLDKSKEHVFNSEPMTYSDIDYSRDDTFDKVTEDEKLKELIGKGEKISSKDVMNILLIGEDLRDTEEGGSGNTDVMMIISVNTKQKTVTMTSIMRDTYVYIPNWYSTRINAAYWNGGVDLTKETIETYMNVKIDRYVLVNFKTFIDIVDTLGGLDITVTEEEAHGYPDADPNGENTRGMENPLDEQNKYLKNKKGTDYIKKAGDLHLNGNQALAYARLRYVGNSDYERTERQRRVIKEMIKESRSLSLIEMDKLATKIFPQIKTDVTKAEAAQLLVDMLDYRNYKIQEFRVPADDTYSNEIISGMDVLLVDFYQNSQMFRELVYGDIELDEEGNEKNMTIE